MTRALVRSLTVALALFAAAPIAVLVFASGLPDDQVRPHGISAQAFRLWRGPDLSRVLEPDAFELWRSLLRTVLASCVSAALASTGALFSAYLISRRRAPRARAAVAALGVAAYALPSVFLMLAYKMAPRPFNLPQMVEVVGLHTLYLLPMNAILSLTYTATQGRLQDRNAAIEGAAWRRRLCLAYQGGLWRAHLGVFCIGALVSWSDIIFSQQMLREDRKLIVDLYVLRYFDQTSTVPNYVGASVFGLIITLLALLLSWFIAVANRR